MVTPASKEDLHRRIPKRIDLDKILCIRTERTVRNDHTIAHDRKLYQIEESTLSKKVMVEERIDGKMLIVCQGKSLRYRQITKRPGITKQPVIRKKRTPYVLPPIIRGGSSTSIFSNEKHRRRRWHKPVMSILP